MIRGSFHGSLIFYYLRKTKAMKNKIKSIKEKIPHVAKLPDGYYNGTWGGYIIEVHYKGRIFELETEEGVRGVGFKVVVQIENGVATFEEVNS